MRFQDHRSPTTDRWYWYDRDGEACWWWEDDEREWVSMVWMGWWDEQYLSDEYQDWLPD